MKKLTLISVFVASLLCGCATTQTQPAPVVTKTGQDVTTLVAEVFQDYADAKKDGVNSLWSIEKGLNAYHKTMNVVGDIKNVITEWKSTKGDNIAEKVANILMQSNATAPDKALAVAKAAEMVAQNVGP